MKAVSSLFLLCTSRSSSAFYSLSRSAYSRPTTALASVSGPVYGFDTTTSASRITLTLFTKDGCTLCDNVKDILYDLFQDETYPPHRLEQVDITDADQKEYWDKYKYDIPVLHVNGKYWIKHRLTREEAIKGLEQVAQGTFISPERDEPNAAARER